MSLALLTALLDCETAHPGAAGPDGGGDSAGMDLGGWTSGATQLTCTEQAGGCVCRPTSGSSANSVACFADKRPGYESPNACCATPKSASGLLPADYQCACAPPVASTWRCFDMSTSCSCTADPATIRQFSSLATEIEPSACVSKIRNCAFDTNSQVCSCTDDAKIVYPSSGVADCTKPPTGVTLKVCPPGLTRVDVCDGHCHPETCFGGAGETCSAFGCTPQTWTCIADLCQKL